MAHEVVNLSGTAVATGHVTHVEFDGGVAKVFLGSGAALMLSGEDADTVAKAFGRHDAKHLTAKEAKAEAKAAEVESPKGHK